MAYVATPRDVFDAIVGGLTRSSALREVGGVVRIELSGDGGGSWLIDFATGKAAPAAAKVDCIVRASARDFMALLEGRMSVSDGLVTGRLQASGEAGRLVRWFEALARAHKPQ